MRPVIVVSARKCRLITLKSYLSGDLINRLSRLVVRTSTAVSLVIASGCAQTGITLPSVGHVVEIAKESAQEPETWIPFTAAAVIFATGSDDNISDWAIENTPVFGSQNSARRASEGLRNSLVAGMAVSSIFAPSPDNEDSKFRTRRIAANALAFGTVAGIVEVGKLSFQRDRPNDRDDRSFPSGHSSGAFSSAILIEQNLNATIEQPWLRKSIKIGTLGSAAATAWARVEASEHFPVDVLVSAALSNLVVKTFYRSIVNGEDQTKRPTIAIETSRHGFKARLNYSF